MAIPPLQKEDRIGEWAPLFRAAVTPLLALREQGHRLAVGMLHAYVCRRIEEMLCGEVVTESRTLEEALEMLITNFDPPKDPHRDMLAICKTYWKPGVLIDDFFYELKEAAIRSQAPIRLAGMVLNS